MKQEKTHKRNPHLNLRRRIYGYKCYDMDHVIFDNQTKRPLLISEDKYGLIRFVDLTGDQFKCICNLADERFPVICTVYYIFDKYGNLVEPEQPHEEMTHVQFLVHPVNRAAVEFMGENRPYKMTELQYVTLLGKLQSQPTELPKNLYNFLRPVTVVPQFIPNAY